MADKAFATLAATSLWAMTMKIPTFFRTTDSNLSGFWKYKWVGQATRMQVISDPRLITKDLFMEYNWHNVDFNCVHNNINLIKYWKFRRKTYILSWYVFVFIFCSNHIELEQCLSDPAVFYSYTMLIKNRTSDKIIVWFGFYFFKVVHRTHKKFFIFSF